VEFNAALALISTFIANESKNGRNTKYENESCEKSNPKKMNESKAWKKHRLIE